jgi:hypothetical protein
VVSDAAAVGQNSLAARPLGRSHRILNVGIAISAPRSVSQTHLAARDNMFATDNQPV